MQYPSLSYFQPNQLVYFLSFSKNETAEKEKAQIGKAIEWSNRRAKEKFGVKEITIAPPLEDQQIRFSTEGLEPKLPSGEPPSFDHNRQVRPAVPMPLPFTLLFPNVRGASLSELAALAIDLDEHRNSLQLDGALLEQVSLNWLTSAGNGQVGSGGPGGRPNTFGGADIQPLYRFKLQFKTNGLPADPERGEGVEVAILDTAPCLHDVADAYHKWGEHGRHPLVKSLLKSVNTPNDRLQIYYASHDTLVRLASYELNQHRYKMTDHGLFVAGIIHTLAPRARLHLIEVLNPYGVGDVYSIARGLNQIAQMVKKSGARWVVNCSLVLNAPTEMDQLEKIGDLPDLLKKGLAGNNAALKDWVDRQGRAIERICDLLYNLGTKVIAASGNDRERQPGSPRPGPRYPAVANSVLGVGALPKNAISQGGRLQTASYSNKADNPPHIGLTTFGGEEGQAPDGSEQGILGLYIGEFPQAESGCVWWFIPPALSALLSWWRKRAGESKNTNGWAWWSGTSFATPIIAGVTTAVLSRANPPATTQNAIEELYLAQAIQTIDEEDVLMVTQG